jgi:integrase
MRRNLTVRAIEALQPALPGQRYDVPDAIVPGFGIRVTDKGKKSYTLTARYPGSSNPTRRTIATVNAIDLAAARETARAWLLDIARGVDPSSTIDQAKVVAAAAQVETFAQVAKQFMSRHVLRNGLRSGPEIQRILNKDVLPHWVDREFQSIRRGDVARLLDGIEERAPVHADHVLAVLSKLCNWYQARDEDYVSPIVRGMKRTSAHDRKRDRKLDDDEIRTVWSCAGEAGTFGSFVKIALLTAQRRAKVQTMRWADIDDDGVWTIPSEAREKSNANSLKLPTLALEILDNLPSFGLSDFVFAGRDDGPINSMTKYKRRLDESVERAAEKSVPNWTIHDLRRTARTLMSRAGVRPEISERVLGHAILGVEGVYDRFTYDEEKADALVKLSQLVAEIVGGSRLPSEVKKSAREPVRLMASA